MLERRDLIDVRFANLIINKKKQKVFIKTMNCLHIVNLVISLRGDMKRGTVDSAHVIGFITK